MSKLRYLILAFAFTSVSTWAIDTSEPFLCAATEVQECLDGFGCSSVLPEEVNAPTFIWVDVDAKKVRSNQNEAGLDIASRQKIGGRHVLQGISEEDSPAGGAAWTLSVEDTTGRFVAAVAVQQASITLFGACTELP